MDLEGKYIANRYEILEKVGNGGMATVYRAKDMILNRNVAVKVLKEEFTTDEEFIRRFNVEAQSAAALTHPNIVSIYDVGNENNIYYIVMELIQGKTLKQIIIKDGKLPWKWSVNIAIQIAQALEAAHKNNIIHRDIKPHNIIITEEGTAKVTDFGIAKAVSNSTITAFGTTIGSVHYFSPEHARGGYTDAKSDIYSLGVVMYEMLTGRVPFDADTPVSIALKHMQEKPVEPRTLNEKIPPAINSIIMKAMEKEPSLRYQSATEMLKDLKLALKNPEGTGDDDSKTDTQKVNVVKNESKHSKPNDKKKGQKKEIKLITYFKNNPKKFKILLIVLAVVFLPILLFGTMKLTTLIVDKNVIKDVYVPNLIGKTEEDLKLMLEGTKLTYEIKSEEYSDEEVGKIIWQSPQYSENYKIKGNSVLEIKISKGKEIVTVPKVAGMTYEDATRTLNESKLVIERVEEKSTKIEEGIVIRQEPDEGNQLTAGEVVKVFISIGNGLEKISVPYVTGKTEADATKELKNNKLKVQIEYKEDKSKQEGIVLSQSAEVGTVLEEGSTVVLTVNRIEQIKSGTVKVNVKALTGYKELDADGNEVKPKNVKIRVTVNEDEVYNKEVSEKVENEIVTVQGIGTVLVKVYVGTTLACQTQMNLNSENPSWTATK